MCTHMYIYYMSVCDVGQRVTVFMEACIYEYSVFVIFEPKLLFRLDLFALVFSA